MFILYRNGRLGYVEDILLRGMCALSMYTNSAYVFLILLVRMLLGGISTGYEYSDVWECNVRRALPPNT